MKRIVYAALLAVLSACCTTGMWTKEEKELINGDSKSLPQVMRVLSVDDPADSVILRAPCKDLPAEALRSPEYQTLASKMLFTVTHPSQDGVGIAAPQVGISRRIIAVQRFDKEGDPFEVYPNIRVIAQRGEREYGPEGCLSVPGRRGNVLRWRDIDIKYTSPKTLQDTVETVTGFTSVIFQHECDHLEGILYTDYADTVMQE